jgi:riboflavin kinase / FMN adenylyltransferase
MRQYIGLEQINHEDDDLRGGAVTIGNFDGMHLGHQRILEETVRAAHRANGPAIAITFDPSPTAVLRPAQAGERLTPLNERLRLIGKCGIDAAVAIRPDPAFLAMAPEVFIDRVIHQVFHATSVVEGPDWRFGKGRAGDISLLARLSPRFEFKVVLVRPLYTKVQDGNPVSVSSTLIRWLLAAGQVPEVNRLLGRPYTLFGPVGRGAAIGTTMGFPTLNIQTGDMALPADGIYACRCKVKGDWITAATHIGPAPTLGRSSRAVEAHLIDQKAGDLYGQPVALECRARLRDVGAFAGVDELVQQMKRDVAQVKELASGWK